MVSLWNDGNKNGHKFSVSLGKLKLWYTKKESKEVENFDYEDYLIAIMIIACGFICRWQTILLRKLCLFGIKISLKS